MNTRAAEDCRDRVRRLGQPWALAICITAREYGLTAGQVQAKLRATRRRPETRQTQPAGEQWWDK